MGKERKIWRSRHTLLAPEHEPELEARAAVHEMSHGMPRMDAEDRAYGDYLQTHMKRAAAHHLAGVRAAHAAGDTQAAAQHHVAYALLARSLGFKEHGEPPAEIAALSKDPALTPVYEYKPHAADAVVLNHLHKLGQQKLGKAETPLGGKLESKDHAGDTWDMSHMLPKLRQKAGERLFVHEAGDNRVAHHFKDDDKGERQHAASFAEDEDGNVHPFEGHQAAGDVTQAAGLALRARRFAAMSGALDKARRVSKLLGAARR